MTAETLSQTRPSRTISWFERYESPLIIAGSLVAFILVWHAVHGSGKLSPTTLASPGAVWAALLRLAQNGQLWVHIGTSGIEFLAGYLPAVVIGVLVGIALGMFRRLESVATPYLMALYATPVVALISVVLAWFGVGLLTKALMVFLLAFFPIVVNTVSGVKQVDSVFLKAGRSFGADRFEQLTKIVVPYALPFIFGGMQLAVGRGLIGMFVGEMFGSYTGLGVLIIRASYEFNAPVMFGGVIVMAVLSVGLSELIRLLGRRLAPWRQEAVI
jgi:ABC-type nitrate/sulfonate/bicarbonate transport system permease component